MTVADSRGTLVRTLKAAGRAGRQPRVVGSPDGAPGAAGGRGAGRRLPPAAPLVGRSCCRVFTP